MADSIFVKGIGFEEQPSLDAAKSRVIEIIDQGAWAYIEIYADVGLKTGRHMKYMCFDKERSAWVAKDEEPKSPEDC